MPGKDHENLALAFLRPAKLENGMLSGQSFLGGGSGAPILDAAIGAVECKDDCRGGRAPHRCGRSDRRAFVSPAGRPDAAILEMKDLGDKVF
ncbi:MAG TPA: hypothetical protein VHT74_21625, partial [Acetobacteraceae bacterium]|nr:hypothetical protein [Acetobacteraceae bacterium]